MKTPHFLVVSQDMALLSPRRRIDRLTSGRMTERDGSILLAFGRREQERPATVVLSGHVDKTVRFRFQTGHAAVRVFLLSSAGIDWKLTVDVLAGSSASMVFLLLGREGTVTVQRSVEIEKNASLHLSTLHLLSGHARIDDRMRLVGEQASFHGDTLAVQTGSDGTDAVQEVLHLAPRSLSVLENSLVSLDGSVLRYDVTGTIAKGNSGADCRQRNRGVILGEKGVIDVSPKLLIDEFDVQASHGCAIGRINADELYYLTSRGLDETTAKRLIVGGYTTPFLSLFTEPGAGRFVAGALARRLGGAV
jgi:Fe-S cluster assembly scaffold protein SufB